MKVRLIQEGGFVGKKKTAEADLSAFGKPVQEKIISLFSQDPVPAAPQSMARDRENLFLEMNGKSISLERYELDADLSHIVEKLRSGLHY